MLSSEHFLTEGSRSKLVGGNGGQIAAVVEAEKAHLAACGRVGGARAAHVISHYGGRPQGDMKAIAAKVL